MEGREALALLETEPFGLILIPYLFDRFFQGSPNRNSEGFGLGLSNVKEIALEAG